MTDRAKAVKAAGKEGRSARERISAAALDILCDDGYDAASVSAIARRAGISTGAIYRHFAGKREILDAAFDEAVITLLTALDPDSLAQIPEGRAQAVDVIQTLMTRAFEFVDSQPRVVKFIVAQSSSSDVEIRHRVLGLESMAVSRIAEGIRRSVEHGWLEIDHESVDLVARVLLTLLVTIVNTSSESVPKVGRITRDDFSATCDAVVRQGLIQNFGVAELAALETGLGTIDRERRRVMQTICHPDDHRSRLLSAALELYALLGYRRVRPADITAHAGLGYGTFYNYFENRRECLQQVFERELVIIGGVVAMVTPIPVSRTQMITDLTGLVTRVAVYAEERGTRLTGVILDTAGIDAAALDSIGGAFTRLAQILADYLRRCRIAEVLDERIEPEAAGALVVAALIAVCLHYVQAHPRKPSVKVVTDTVMRTLCCGAEHHF